MSRHSSVKNKYTNANNHNNNTTNSNSNMFQPNPLSLSTSTFQRRGVRRRWENMRRSNQSVENVSRTNSNNINTTNNNNGRISVGGTTDLNLVNINSDNNIGRNISQVNHESNGNNANLNNNNIIHNHNNYNIVNNFNNYDMRGNSINADSCFVQFRRIRKNYLDKQNFMNNLNNINNVSPNNNNNINNNNIININSNNNIDNNNNIRNNNSINNNNINNNANVNNANINESNMNTNESNINNTNNNININNTNNDSNMNNTSSTNNTSNINNTNNAYINNTNNIESNPSNNITTNEANNSINNHITITISETKKEKPKKEEKKDPPKKEQKESLKDESIGSEIKDTVKCYICFEKINKPKMCPHCHRMACEKCLYNWFINLKKDKCGFCRANTNFKEMISVPFMDIVVNFVEKFFNKDKTYINNIDKELEYCPEHENELLYYYCLDCGKAYCKTCFVFFGEEKDKHTEHSIIEYEKYKNMSFPLLKKNLDKLESNIQHVEENIKRCISYKESYEHQRKVGNEFINNLQDAFNNQMDVIISSIDNHIKKLKEYINEYNKYKKDIDEFYYMIKHKNSNSNPNSNLHQDKSCESLIIKLTNINQHKFFSSKDIEKLSDLSKNFYVNTYQSKIGEFNHENIFLSRGLKMGNSPCELVIDNKQRNEVLISLNIPKNKFHGVHNFKALILIRKKGECMQSYDLDEYNEDYNNIYLKKKIPWDFIGSSIFKLKGIMHDFYFS